MPKANSNLFRVIFFAFALCVLFVGLAQFWPVGTDYFYTERPIVEAFFRGETHLYDAASPGYYLLPWSVLVFLPTLVLPFLYGQSLLLVASLLGLLASVVAAKENHRLSPLVLGLALVNLYTFDLFLRANVDGIVALGVGLAWLGIVRKRPLLLGMGLWFLSIKPVNVILTCLVLARAAWSWPLADKLKSVLPLALTCAVSFPVFGFDWPLRYIRFEMADPPLIYLQTTLWRVFQFFGLDKNLALWLFVAVVILFGIAMIKAKHVDRRTLALALSTNLVFSPYALGSHYVLLAPAFVVWAQGSKWRIAIWFLTLVPLVRLMWGFDVAWLDIVYPLALMVGVGYLISRVPVDSQ